MQPLGHHLLLDLWGVSQSLLDDIETLESELVAAATRGGAHVLEARFRHFEPHGVSGVLILAESHLALHTWPELGYAAVDVFTCGAPEIADAVARAVVAALAPGEHLIRRFDRGPSVRPVATPRAV